MRIGHVRGRFEHPERTCAAGRVSRVLLSLALALVPLQAGCSARADGAIDGVSEDQRITAEVQRILVDDNDIVAEDLQVETTGGVVVITGVQTDVEAVSDMLRRVARVRGVTEVVNRVRILR